MADTKEAILKAALALFAKDGFEAVSVSDIAGKLNITKGALYRHFKNKRDIFDSILARMEEEDARRAHEYNMPEGSYSQTAKEYSATPYEKIKVYALAQFMHWTEDEFASNFRKLLTLEQYRNPEMARLYGMYFSSGPLNYMEDIFFELTKNRQSARQTALGFYAPMYLLYSVYDLEENKESVLNALKYHIDNFGEIKRK